VTAMEDTTTSPIARYERPESPDGGKMGRMGGGARRARTKSWPQEVSSGPRHLCIASNAEQASRAWSCRSIRFGSRFRSRKDSGVWVMTERGLGNPTAHGRTLSEATAALIMMLAPDVERSTRRRIGWQRRTIPNLHGHHRSSSRFSARVLSI
jgi:hypothetical protein